MKRGILLVLLLLICGCAKEYVESDQAKTMLGKDPDAAGAIMAVRGYNRNIVGAYLNNDPSPVREFTDDKEYQKLAHMMEGMKAQNIRLESKLESLQVEKIDRWGKDNVLVTTVEKWRYRRVNTATGTEVKPYTDIEYHMNYTMIRPKGKWILFSLTTA